MFKKRRQEESQQQPERLIGPQSTPDEVYATLAVEPWETAKTAVGDMYPDSRHRGDLLLAAVAPHVLAHREAGASFYDEIYERFLRYGGDTAVVNFVAHDFYDGRPNFASRALALSSLDPWRRELSPLSGDDWAVRLDVLTTATAYYLGHRYKDMPSDASDGQLGTILAGDLAFDMSRYDAPPRTKALHLRFFAELMKRCKKPWVPHQLATLLPGSSPQSAERPAQQPGRQEGSPVFLNALNAGPQRDPEAYLDPNLSAVGLLEQWLALSSYATTDASYAQLADSLVLRLRPRLVAAAQGAVRRVVADRGGIINLVACLGVLNGDPSLTPSEAGAAEELRASAGQALALFMGRVNREWPQQGDAPRLVREQVLRYLERSDRTSPRARHAVKVYLTTTL
jgi:hypothetical protein